MNKQKRHLSVPEQHQLAIARKTLKLSDMGAQVLGGMTINEARQCIKELTGSNPGARVSRPAA